MGNELLFEGKKYISASRASKIIGYNSDYIGQLCRKNSLDCRMVGRTWFVSEESLKNHKATASVTPRGRIPIYKKSGGLGEGPATELGNAPHHPEATGTTGSARPEFAFHSANFNWTDFANRRGDKLRVRKFIDKVCLGVAIVVLLVAASADLFSPQSLVNLDTMAFRADENLGVGGILAVKILAVKNEIVTALTTAGFSRHGMGDSLSYSANVFESLGVSLGQKASDAIRDATHGVSRGLVYVNDFLDGAATEVRLVVSNIGLLEGIFDKPKERMGVAVLPSAEDVSVNEQVKQYVIGSFSDETEIIPDESGNSGLIRPVFKERNDQEYLYVVVPVKEDGG